jgi:hypothetical protein
MMPFYYIFQFIAANFAFSLAKGIAVGIYLIDTYCLGIKDCFVRLTNTYDYKNLLEQVGNSCGEMKLIDPTYANTLILKQQHQLFKGASR